MKEKCWKIATKRKREGKGEKGEKGENWRENGKNERSGGQRRKGENKREGKVGKPRGPQACYTISQTSLEFCLTFPVRLCTKSDHVRTVFKKRCKVEQSEHRIVTTTEDNRCSTCSEKVRVEKCSHEMVLVIFRASTPKHKPHAVLTTVQKLANIQQNTAHSSHHCL